MVHRVMRHVVLLAALVAILTVGGCARRIEGTYTAGIYTLELKSAGKATFAIAGGALECTYTRESKKVILTCPGQASIDFGINDDGSLQGMMIGAMKKTK